MKFKVVEQDDKKAIFKDRVQISDWFDCVYEDGLVKGQSNYFVAKKDGKVAIYEYKDGRVNKITDGFDWIWSYGLVEGKTNSFFIAERRGRKGLYEIKDGQAVKLLESDAILIEEFMRGESDTIKVLIDGKWETYKYENGEIIKVENKMEQNKDVVNLGN